MYVQTIMWFSELCIINIYSWNWVVYSLLLLEVPKSEMFKFLYKKLWLVKPEVSSGA